MYRHILLPTDGSELSRQCTRAAIQFAKEQGAKVTVLNVLPEYSASGFAEFPDYGQWSLDDFIKETEQEGNKAVAVISAEAQAHSVPCETVLERHQHPYRAIIDVAAQRQCDLIFMASHGRRGISALVLGSETHKVLTHCKIPVLVHR